MAKALLRHPDEGEKFELLVANIAEIIDKWNGEATQEQTHEFARRVVGLVREHETKMARRAR